MILPIIGGFFIGKYVKDTRIALFVSFATGLLMGIFAGIISIPIVYPFFIIRSQEIVIPEIRLYYLCLITSDITLFSEAVALSSYGWGPPMTMVSILSAIGALGGLIGSFLGIRGISRRKAVHGREGFIVI